MFAVEITDSAENDLDRITDYLGVNLANQPAAVALLDEVDRTIAALEDDPWVFPLCRDSRLADLGFHKAVVRAYIMVYEVDSDDEVVRVLRFFHSSEDYSNKL